MTNDEKLIRNYLVAVGFANLGVSHLMIHESIGDQNFNYDLDKIIQAYKRARKFYNQLNIENLESTFNAQIKDNLINLCMRACNQVKKAEKFIKESNLTEKEIAAGYIKDTIEDLSFLLESLSNK